MKIDNDTLPDDAFILADNIRLFNSSERFLCSETAVEIIQDAAEKAFLDHIAKEPSADATLNGAAAEQNGALFASPLNYFEELGVLRRRPDGAAAPSDLDRLGRIYWDELRGRGSVDHVREAEMERPARWRVLPGLAERLTPALQGQVERFVDEAHAANDGADAGLDIVLTHDYLDPALAEWNRRALDEKRPWLLAKPVGTVLWIGPLIIPGATACWSCLAVRLRRNQPARIYLERKLGVADHAPLQGALPSTLRTALGLIQSEAEQILRTGKDALHNCILTFDTFDQEFAVHAFAKAERCPDCSDAPMEVGAQPLEAAPVSLHPLKKTFLTDGGHRSCQPEETLARYAHLISPITGVVREMFKIDTGDGPNHTYISVHSSAAEHETLASLQEDISGRSSGKGGTDIQSQASGFGEAVERFSASFHADEPRFRASMTELGEAAIHPNAILQFHDRQYDEREAWNKDYADSFQFVPERFDPDAVIEWSPLWSMTQRRTKYLPAAMMYFGYPRAQSPFGRADSNGLSAGNRIEEALNQGLYELIERDAVGIWWNNRLRCPAVELDSFDDPYIREMHAYCKAQGRRFWALDLTADIALPVFAALSSFEDDAAPEVLFGFGAHLDPRIALRRALTELNQSIAGAIHARNASHDPDNYDPADMMKGDVAASLWLRNASPSNQPFILPAEDRPARSYADYEHHYTDDVASDVRYCQGLLEAKGLEVLAADVTRPDVGMPVAKVLVPGLRHMWRRLAPGRLYDVPVALGRQDRPTPFDEMNPIPCYL